MGNPTPPNYLVRNCVEKAHPTYIYGGRGTLKSMNALAIAIAIASPEVSQILGYAVEDHGPVVVFDSELNANVFNSRAVALCNGLGIDKPENLYYLNAVGMHPSQSFPNLHAFCEHIQATAAVVDSFGFAVRGDPESYKDVRNHSTEYVDPLIAKGVAVILVEHKPHQGNHIFGSVAKEYHGRYIFRVEDLDGESRAKGERNTRLINEKASFTDEGQRITLLTRFEDDRIVIEPQGTTEEESEDISTADAEVKVRRSLMASDKTTDELAEDTGLSDTYLRNKILPDMRNRKAIHKVGTRGRGSAIVWGLRPPDDASTSSLLPREVEDGEASDTVVSDSAELDKLVDDFDQSNTIALDLETMPPPGWIWEVVGGYRAWRKKLRNKPKPERMRKVWDDLKEKTYKAYATNPATAQVRLISMATHEGLNKLVDVNPQIDIQPLLDALRNKALITHNGAFDLGVLRERYGYVHSGHVMDTQLLYVMHHYAEAGRRDKMENGMRRLPDPRDTKVDLYGTGKKDTGMSALAAVTNQYLGITMNKESQASDWSAPTLSDEQLTYALMDTKILLDLSDELVDRLSGIGMGAIVKLESRAFPALIDMALNGFPADKGVALAMAEKYRVESLSALDRVQSLLPQEKAPDGTDWNWNKADHIRAVLRLLGANIDKKGYPKTDKTQDPATTAKALRTIKSPAATVEWVKAFLTYKGLQKVSGDFASKYAGLIQADGTIKGSFDTVSTGRLSCRRPNLQQVPKRGEQQTKEGMRIRDIFRPAEGDVFIIADFAQVELLLAATIAKRETGKRGHMLEVFQQGKDDIHKVTAASLTGRPVSKVTSAERSLAKAVNFGLVYGAEAETLMEYARDNYGVDMSLEDAKAYRKAFFERYPELEAWHRLVEACCDRDEEYSTTPMGRRRKLPRWISSGKIAHTTAKNAPVQGAGADAIKLTLAKLFEDRHNCPGNPRLNVSVHDEVVLSVVEEHAATAVEWVEKHMADAEREAVGDPESPVVVEVEAKKSWA